MSLPAWFATLGLVAVSSQQPRSWDGPFDSLPAAEWSVKLPGPPSQSATHTELGGPVISGDYIYVGTANDDALLVLRRDGGALAHRLAADAPVQATPVVDAGRVYFTDAAGTTWCYDRVSDRMVWNHKGGAPIVSSPRVAGGRVFVADVGDVIVALDKDDGSLAWRYAHKLDPSRMVDLELYGAPSPLPVGDVVVVGFSDGTVAGVQARDGELLWQRRVGEGAYPDIVADAALAGDAVVVSGYSEPLVSIDLATRASRWRLDVGGAQPAVVLDDGSIVHGGGDGVLRALDPNTGEVRWTFDTQTGTALTQAVPIEAGLLVGASGGSLYLVDPTDGALLWRYEPLHLLSGITSTPAVDGRQIVVLTNAGNLVSFVATHPDTSPEGDHE